jgi:hypothetical protein
VNRLSDELVIYFGGKNCFRKGDGFGSFFASMVV